MKKMSAIAIVVAAAGTAVAAPVYGDYSTYTIISGDAVSATELDASFSTRAPGVVYSSMDPNVGSTQYSAFAAATGVLGFDDYTSTNGGPITLDSLRFVGGVVNAGETLFFDFFDATGTTFIDGFGVTLGSGGNFIWTIGVAPSIVIDDAGIMQVTADVGSTGQWFLSDSGPTIGSEDNTFGGANGGLFNHKFELNNLPTPGSVALLTLGGLVATRRRR